MGSKLWKLIQKYAMQNAVKQRIKILLVAFFQHL